MIRSWFKIFIKHFKKNPLYPIINTLGLILGITCFVLVTLYVSHELGYEKWNPELKNIYRPIRVFDNGDVWTTSPRIMMTTAKEELPEVQDVFMTNWAGNILFDVDSKKLMEGVRQVTPNFFDFHPYPIRYGNAESSFQNPNDLVLSDTFAQKLFGSTDPVGKTVEGLYGNETVAYTITAVYKTKELLSDLQPPILKVLPKASDNDAHWGNFNYWAYFKLNPGVDATQFADKLDKLYDTHAAKTWDSIEEYYESKEERMSLENLADIHLFSKALKGRGANTIIILSALALLILLISAINFINLSISGATQRAKEVAVRKTLGTHRLKIIAQFVFEVFLQCLFALVVALALAELLLPAFNTLMDAELSMLSAYNKWSIALGIIALLVLIAGIFPGLYLSNFNPTKVLKGNFGRSKSGNTLKKTMIVFQFVISAVFLVSAFIIKAQLSYMNDKDLGFQKDQMLMINIQNGSETWKKMDMFKQELAKLPGVAEVGTTTRPPGTNAGNGSNSSVSIYGGDESHQADMHFVDHDYFPAMGVKILKGRNFTKDLMPVENERYSITSQGDTITKAQIMVNQKLVDVFELKNPIGTIFDIWGERGEIIGVVDNYMAKGFDELTYPAVYMNYMVDDNSSWGKPSHVMVKLNGTDIPKTITDIENFWSDQIEPRFPFNYEFLDENFSKLFTRQARLEKLVTLLSIIMIFISLMGLFAIASHTVQQRYKEVAIKKALGASAKTLILFLVKDFIIITAISLLIALPIAFFLSDRWLQDFAYRISMPVLPFVLTPLIMLLLTVAIVMVKAVNALQLNLVTHLKYE